MLNLGEECDMKEKDYKDKTFRVTGRDLGTYVCYGFLMGMFLLLIGMFAQASIEGLFRDTEGGGFWASMGAIGTAATVMAATAWLIWRISMPRLNRWLDERIVPVEDEARGRGETR